MAVITFANAKGGAGKTTAALILSTELARQGHRVVVLDADPQRWITSWAEVSGHIANLTVISHITPGSLECHIREMKDEADYIVIDLAGAKDQIVALALAVSDQVLIPVQGCAMDAKGPHRSSNSSARSKTAPGSASTTRSCSPASILS